MYYFNIWICFNTHYIFIYRTLFTTLNWTQDQHYYQTKNSYNIEVIWKIMTEDKKTLITIKFIWSIQCHILNISFTKFLSPIQCHILNISFTKSSHSRSNITTQDLYFARDNPSTKWWITRVCRIIHQKFQQSIERYPTKGSSLEKTKFKKPYVRIIMSH